MYPNPNIDYSPDSVTYETERYTASLDQPTAFTRKRCPLCGKEIYCGNAVTQTANGYTIHGACFSKQLSEYAECAEDTTIDDWMSNAIFDAIQVRGDQDDYNY